MSDLQLKDPSLLVEAAYVAGAWVEATDENAINVTNPATGAVIGRVPNLGAAEPMPRSRPRQKP